MSTPQYQKRMKAREKSGREKERQEKGKEEDIRTEEILDQLVCFLNFLFMCMSDVIGVSAIRGQKRTSDPLELELEEVMIVLRGCWEQISVEDYRSPRGTLSSQSQRMLFPTPNALTYTFIFEGLHYCHKNITETERTKQAP